MGDTVLTREVYSFAHAQEKPKQFKDQSLKIKMINQKPKT